MVELSKIVEYHDQEDQTVLLYVGGFSLKLLQLLGRTHMNEGDTDLVVMLNLTSFHIKMKLEG